MKTPRPESRPEASRTDRSSHAVRRRRTLAAFGCESLEGRKLMTGFAGASGAMAGNGPADLGGMSGAGQGGMGDAHRSDRGMGQPDGTGAGQGSDQGSASANAQAATSTSAATSTPTQGGDDSHLGMDANGGARNDFMVRRGGGDPSFGGPGMGGDPADQGGAAGIPLGDRGGPGGSGGQAGGDLGGPAGSGDQGTGNAQLDADLTKLRADEQAIHDKSQVTPALEAAVRKDNQAIAAAATGTADATALKTLQTDQQTIFGGLTDGARPTDAQQATLQADRDAVLKSQGVSQALIDQLAADRLAVKTASNFTSDDQATLDADRKAIEADRTAAATADGSTATAATTADGSTDTAATATAATTAAAPDASATAATPAPDSTGQPTPGQAPAAAPTPGNFDPTATQVTSTAAPMAATGMGGATGHSHHGRPGFGHGGMNHGGGSGVQAAAITRGAGGHSRRGGGR